MNHKILVPTTLLCMSLSPLSGAAEGQNNGKPFQALQELITANEALITENETSITALEGQVSQLQLEMTSVQNQMSTLSNRVETNESEIGAMLLRLTNSEEDIDQLGIDLNTLVLSTNQLATDLRSELSAAEVEIRNLIDGNTALISDLNGLVTQLRSDTDSNTGNITQLTTDVLYLLTLSSNNSNVIAQLVEDRDDMENKLTDIIANIDMLEMRVTSLERLHNAFFDFSLGEQGWVVGGDAQTVLGLPSTTPNWTLASALPGSVGQVLPGIWWTNPNYGQMGAERSYVTSPTLTVGAEEISVNFDSFSANEGGYPTAYDVEHVQISINGGAFADVHGNTSELHRSNDRTFRNITFTYDGVSVGDSIRIRFLYDTGDGCCGSNVVHSWAFGNVGISGAF